MKSVLISIQPKWCDHIERQKEEIDRLKTKNKKLFEYIIQKELKALENEK